MGTDLRNKNLIKLIIFGIVILLILIIIYLTNLWNQKSEVPISTSKTAMESNAPVEKNNSPKTQEKVPADKIRNGDEVYVWPNKSIYDGHWKNNDLDGFGVLSYSKGDQYSGYFIKGKKEGNGKYTWDNGEIYAGSWKNDCMHGFGTYTFKNKDKYIGNWGKNMMNGYGTYKFVKGQTLKGIWKNNKYSHK